MGKKGKGSADSGGGGGVGGFDAKPKKKLSRAARRELSDSEGDDDHNDLDFADTRSEASVGSLYSERTLDLGGMNRGHASSASLALPDGHYHDDDDDDDDDSDGEGDGYYEDDRALKERGKISAGVGDLSEKRGKTREDALTSLRETLRNFHESHGPLLEAHSEELLGGAMASLRRGGREGALAAELLGVLFVSLGGDYGGGLLGGDVWRRAGAKLRLVAVRGAEAAAAKAVGGKGGGGGGGGGSGSSNGNDTGGSSKGGSGGGKRGKRRAATSKSSKGGGGGGGGGGGNDDDKAEAAAEEAAAALGAFAMGCLVSCEDRPDDVDDAMAFAATVATGGRVPTSSSSSSSSEPSSSSSSSSSSSAVAEPVRVAALQAWALVSTMVGSAARRGRGAARLLPTLAAILDGGHSRGDDSSEQQQSPRAASSQQRQHPSKGAAGGDSERYGDDEGLEGEDEENGENGEEDDGEGNGASPAGLGPGLGKAGFELKFQAGFTVALLGEARAAEKAELEEEGESYACAEGEEELWLALRASLHRLANESSKRLSKAAKKEQHAAFRHFLRAVDASLAAFNGSSSSGGGGGGGDDLRYFDACEVEAAHGAGAGLDAKLGAVVKFPGGKVECATWSDLARLSSLRQALRGGIGPHLAGNVPLLPALLGAAYEGSGLADLQDLDALVGRRERRKKGSAASRKATQGRTKQRNAKRSAKGNFFDVGD